MNGQQTTDTASATNGAKSEVFTIRGDDIIPNYAKWLKKAHVRILWAMYLLLKEDEVVSSEKILLKIHELFQKHYSKQSFLDQLALINKDGRVLIVKFQTKYYLTPLGSQFIASIRNDPSEECKFKPTSAPEAFDRTKLRAGW